MINNELISYNIIIIDDSNITVKLMCYLFKNSPKINNIMTATDGLDAINKIYNNMNMIDIVFTDNEMPNLNGKDVTKLLRGINFNKLIIGITDSINDELSEFYSCGIDYLFTKPINKKKIDLILNFLNKNDINRYPNKKLKLINDELVLYYF